MGIRQGEGTSAEFLSSGVITAIVAFVADSANDGKTRELAYLALIGDMASKSVGTNMTLDVATFATLQAYF